MLVGWLVGSWLLTCGVLSWLVGSWFKLVGWLVVGNSGDIFIGWFWGGWVTGLVGS